MSCPIPSPLDVRHFLEGFCLETQDQTNFTVTFLSGATTLNMGASVSLLRENMAISGTGIQTGTSITAVNYSSQSVTISLSTSSGETDSTVTVTKNTFLTDDWIIKRRDQFVIPWIQKRTSLNILGTRTITEYVSGNGLTSLILSYKPIIEIQELTYINTPDDFISNLQQSVVVDKEQGMLMSKWRLYDASDYTIFRRGIKNIKVTYTVGFSDICTEAPDVPEAILNWLAALALQLIGSRGGGGNISQSGYNQTFGNRGKYSEAIKMSEANAMAILRGYFNYVGAP